MWEVKEKGKEMDKKLTKREFIEELKAIVFQFDTLNDKFTIENVTAFLNHELELLDRKHNASPNPKREAEKRAAKHEILNGIAAGFYRASEIATYANMSVQRCSALLRQLVADGSVVRVPNGKVTEFHLAE